MSCSTEASDGGKTQVFGWTWFYLSAMMGLFTILNYVFSVTLRIIGLWKERGFGWWLLGGLWAAAYNLLLLPTTVVKNIMTFNREQAEKALPMTIVTTGSASPKNDAGALPSLGGAGSDAGGNVETSSCSLYTSDAADEEDSVDLGGRRTIQTTKTVSLPHSEV